MKPGLSKSVRKVTVGLALAALLCAPMVGKAQETTYSFTTIIYPGDTFTQTLDINNSGTIAGRSRNP